MDYRSELLNGRHVIDVLKAVCNPSGVSEAELDRIRRETTENAKDIGAFFADNAHIFGEQRALREAGMWSTSWALAK